MLFYLLIVSTLAGVYCDVLVFIQSTDQIIEEFRSLAANFGPSLPVNGLKVLAVNSYPDNGCKTIQPPPENVTIFGEKPKWAAVIARYNCSFEDKVRNAQKAGFDAVIVFNRKSDELEIMSANDDSDIFIPSLFVGQTTGSLILTNYQYFEGFALVLNDDLPFNINTHLIIPFCIVVGLCLVVMLGFMIARCIRERRRLLRYRLPSSSLKKLESRKFNKNDLSYDTCAICLDDYEEGDRLRILPCKHAYHTKCIDPWLTKNRRVCPVCKRKVYIAGERQRRQRRRRSSTSDSITSYEADDHTPLINPSQNNTSNHGTFPNASAPPPESQDVEPIPVNPGTSDEELLDGQNSQNRRFNPFDRVPNLPPHLVSDLYPPIGDENLTRWQKFKRFFTINRQSDPLNIQGDGDDVDVVVQVPSRSDANNIPTRPASNNLMNANLSGSFRDQNGLQARVDDDEPLLGNEADDDDDVEILGASGPSENSRRRKKNKKRHRSAPAFVQQRHSPRDDEPTTSSSLQNQSRSIGIAALPNPNFNPSQQPPSTSRARNQFV